MRDPIESEKTRNEKMALTARLTRSIGHEIRNPLNNITLAIDALQHESEASEASNAYIDILKRNVDRISKLIRELLESSRPAAVELQEISAKVITDKVKTNTRDRFRLRGVKLEVADFDRSIKIHADPVQFSTALSNLVINALEAIKEKDGEVSIDVCPETSDCLFRIRDNGIGMNEDELEVLFDPFYTNKKGGIGLGLTLAQNIIAAHNGSIRVKSSKGKGTTFDVRISAVAV